LREAVLDYLDENRSLITQEGQALDCCCGTHDYGLGRLFPKLVIETCDQTDFPERRVDHVADVHNLCAIPDDRYDALFLLEALEHIERPHDALAAVRRVLRPRGVLALTTVMDFPIHRHPHDYWRFCPDGLAVLLDGFHIEDMTLEGRREKPQGIWVIARKVSGNERIHNLAWAREPNRVHNSLTRWFSFKEEVHYRIARLFFGERSRKPENRY